MRLVGFYLPVVGDARNIGLLKAEGDDGLIEPLHQGTVAEGINARTDRLNAVQGCFREWSEALPQNIERRCKALAKRSWRFCLQHGRDGPADLPDRFLMNSRQALTFQHLEQVGDL